LQTLISMYVLIKLTLFQQRVMHFIVIVRRVFILNFDNVYF